MKLTPEVTYLDDEMKDKTRIVECPGCRDLTDHVVKHSFMVCSELTGVDYGWDGHKLYEIIQCQSCSSVSFRREDYFSEDGTTVHLFPKRESSRIEAKDFLTLPSNLRKIYAETIEAINHDFLTVAAGGLRSLVEGVGEALQLPEDHPSIGEVRTLNRRPNVTKIEVRRSLKFVEKMIEESFGVSEI